MLTDIDIDIKLAFYWQQNKLQNCITGQLAGISIILKTHNSQQAMISAEEERKDWAGTEKMPQQMSLIR